MPVPSHGSQNQLQQRTSALAHRAPTHSAHAQPDTTAPTGTITYKHKEQDIPVSDPDLALEHAMEEGRTPYHWRAQVVEDRQLRESMNITPADYGTRWRATFRTLTGDAPECGPGDHVKARQYWLRLRDAIGRGGWSPSEAASLYKQEKLWGRRAAGQEPRFEVMGTTSGRADRDQRGRMEMLQAVINMRRIAKGEL